MSTASATAFGTSAYAPPATSAPTVAQYLSWMVTGTPFPATHRAPSAALPAFATAEEGLEYIVSGRAFARE